MYLMWDTKNRLDRQAEIIEKMQEIMKLDEQRINDLKEYLDTQNQIIKNHADWLSVLSEEEDDEEYSNNNHVVGER